MQPTTCRSGRHLIKTSQDRRPNGGCIRCQRENQRRYAQNLRDKAKMADQLAGLVARDAQRMAEVQAQMAALLAQPTFAELVAHAAANTKAQTSGQAQKD